MHTTMLHQVVLATFLVVVSSAPLTPLKAPDDVGKSVAIRNKRSEEAIIYGNHQNMARIKKGDPHPRPFQLTPQSSEQDIDDDTVKPAGSAPDEVSLPVPKEPVSEQQEDDVVAGINNLVSPHDDKTPDQDMTEDEEKEIEKLLQPDDADNIDVEEKNLERLLEAEQSSEKIDEETLNELRNEEFSVDNPGTVVDEYPNDDDESSGDGELGLPENDIFRGDYYDDDGYVDESYPDFTGTYDGQQQSGLLKAFREKRSTAKNKKARSIPKIINAEDMSMMSDVTGKLGGRVKRDLALSPEELQAFLDSEYGGNDEPYDDIDRRTAPSENWSSDDMEDLLKDEIARYDIDPRSYDMPDYMPDESEGAPVEYGNQEADLALLRYLYGEGGDGPVLDYPNEVEETWEDLGPAQEIRYEPPFYNPEPESEPPRKRQYMSFVPGVRKREPDFYPYQYGPDSRWGAFVLQPELEKRSEVEEYKKLFELAQALNGPESETDMEQRRESNSPQEEESDYWTERRK